MSEYRLALQTNPVMLEPLVELAWTLATSPEAALRRVDEAVGFAERARQLTGDRDVRVLDATAAAYAAAGRYADAISALERAVGMIPRDAPGASDTLRLLQDRLTRYRQGQPFLDETRAERR
jgi:tetratricopeptide (TPR) repeat protein